MLWSGKAYGAAQAAKACALKEKYAHAAVPFVGQGIVAGRHSSQSQQAADIAVHE
jgi:hypothetical protein